MQGITDYRTSHRYDSACPSTRKMLWEVTRVISGMPDDSAAVGWLQSAGSDETAPVILGYQQLCSALTESQPEADAICLARLAVAAASFRLASCRFAEWWFDRPHVGPERDIAKKLRGTGALPSLRQPRPRAD